MSAILWFAFVVINAFLIKYRGKKISVDRPELTRGYGKLFRGFLIYLNIPTLMLGACELFGRTQNCTDLRSEGPFVFALYITIILLVAAGFIWVYFGGGAEFLSKHPGAVNFKSALGVKLGYALVVVGGLVILVTSLISYIEFLNNR